VQRRFRGGPRGNGRIVGIWAGSGLALAGFSSCSWGGGVIIGFQIVMLPSMLLAARLETTSRYSTEDIFIESSTVFSLSLHR
jgi:hypothetical protein